MLEAVLRIIHVFFGVFLVGYYFLMVPIIVPALNKLGHGVRGQFMQAIGPAIYRAMVISALVIIGTGIVLTLILVGGDFRQVFNSSWGWVMIFGLVLTIAWAIVGFGFIDPVVRRAEKLGHAARGRMPTSEETQQLERLSQKVRKLLAVNFVIVFVILFDMVIARYM